MPDVDSPATGRRDTDEIEVTPAMIAAGLDALTDCDPRFTPQDEILREVYRRMSGARSEQTCSGRQQTTLA